MGVGRRSLPQRLLRTQQSNPHLACLLHWQADPTPSEPPRKPLVQGVCESHSVVPNSLRLSSPWDSPGQNTGVGSRSLLQGIFPTQGQTQVSHIAGEYSVLWKLKGKWNWEASRGSCPAHTVSIQIPTGRDLPWISYRSDITLLLPGGRFSPSLTTVQPMRDRLNSAKENPLYSELPISSSQLSIYNKPSQLPLLLYKQFSLLCLARLACYLL